MIEWLNSIPALWWAVIIFIGLVIIVYELKEDTRLQKAIRSVIIPFILVMTGHQAYTIAVANIKLQAQIVNHNAELAVQQNTLDFLSVEREENYQYLWARFYQLKDNPIDVATSDVRTELRKFNSIINQILNRHEILAIGIEKNIIDEDMVHLHYKNRYVDSWPILEPYITARRESSSHDDYYINFENLVAKWERDW